MMRPEQDAGTRMASSKLRTREQIHRAGLALAAIITAVMLGLAWIVPSLSGQVRPTFFDRLEDASFDLRFLLRGPRPPHEEILVVAVDEDSLRRIGRWPWSRDTQARLVEAIAADRPRVIGLDLLYPEPEVTAYQRGLRELRTEAGRKGGASPALRALLEAKLAEAETDQRLAASLSRAGNVVLALPFIVPVSGEHPPVPTTAPRPSASPHIPVSLARHQFVLVRHAGTAVHSQPHLAVDHHAPLDLFAEEAVSLGHVYSQPDPDGVTRYEYLALRFGAEDAYFPSFALEIARLALGIPRERMVLELGEGVRLGDRFIPADQKARLLIDFLGPERTFAYVPAADVLQNRVPAGRFQGKVVLVGTTALGTYDQKTTPFSANFPGVEKNATVVDNVLRGQFLRKTVWVNPIDIGLIVLFGLGVGGVLPRLRALPGAVLAGIAFLGYGGTAYWTFVRHGIWLDVVYPLATLSATFVAITVLRFMTEEQRAKEIRRMFSSYVSPRIVDQLIEDPRKAQVGGHRKELTMLFSDIKGFTAFSEQHPPEDVVTQLNEYLKAMTEVVLHWDGTLDKFVGDALVVFWGAPVDQPNHAELAIKCALHMRRRLSELQDKWRDEGKTPFDIGIGINTGPAVVGNIGAEGKKMDYTMIGDHVNLAARVEGMTRRFDCSIVLTDYAAAALRTLMVAPNDGGNRGRVGHVRLRRLGTVSVKGKAQSVVVYALDSLPHDAASIEDDNPEPLSRTAPEE